MKIDAAEFYAENKDRAQVDLEVFLRRVETGWKAERALTTRQEGRGSAMSIPSVRNVTYGNHRAKLYEAFGRSLLMADWVRMSGQTDGRIRRGITSHGSLERFLLHIGWHPDTPHSRPEPRKTAVKKATSGKRRVINLDDDLLD